MTKNQAKKLAARHGLTLEYSRSERLWFLCDDSAGAMDRGYTYLLNGPGWDDSLTEEGFMRYIESCQRAVVRRT